MDEKEDIETYFLRVDEVVNAIRGLAEEINESLLRSLLFKYDAEVSTIEETRSLLFKYDAEVSAIEETRELTKMTMDELHVSLIAYEMRTGTESNQPNNEESFKDIKKTKEKDNNLDEEITHFVRRLLKGTERYKGKSPLK
jgi:hypothetical protein